MNFKPSNSWRSGVVLLCLLGPLWLTACSSVSTPVPPSRPVLTLPPPPAEALKSDSAAVKDLSQRLTNWQQGLTEWRKKLEAYLK